MMTSLLCLRKLQKLKKKLKKIRVENKKPKKRNAHTKPHPFFIIFHHLAIRMKKN